MGTLLDRERLQAEIGRLRVSDPTTGELATFAVALRRMRAEEQNHLDAIGAALSSAAIITLTGRLDEIATRIAATERDRESVAKRRAEWDQAARRVESFDSAWIRRASELSRFAHDADVARQRDLLMTLGVKVYAYPPDHDGPRWKIEARVPLVDDPLAWLGPWRDLYGELSAAGCRAAPFDGL